MAEESSAGFSEQFKELVTENEKRMKAMQDQIANQWEAQRKAISDQVEHQRKAMTELVERQWNAQKKAIEDAQNAIGGMFRRKPE